MSKADRARKLAKTLPRDAKGKFLPRGSKNLFKKKINSRTHKSGHKRKRKTTRHGSHNTAGSVLELLNPIKDVIDLLAPLLGGSHTKEHKKQVNNFKKLVVGKKPMAKRRRNNNNGSTVDIFPNFLTGTITQSADDAFTTVLVNTPIPRIQTSRSGQKATVMELLWVELVVPNIKIDKSLDNVTFQMVIGTTPNVIISFNNPRVFMEQRWDAHFSASGLMITEMPTVYNMQSMDGHGYLLAAESFHVSIFSVGTGQQNIAEWRLYYRFVAIPLSEFIGLVQSTQQ